IVGLGRIGKAVATRAAAFGMKLIAYEPYPDAAFVAQQGVSLLPLEKVLAEADFITLHLPLTDDCKHLINRRTLEIMKPTGYLVNTSRGGLICEADLLVALKAKRIAGAALDVYEQEPTTANNPLFQLDNVLLTPHAAGVDLQSRDDMAMSASQAILSLCKGEW